MSHEFHLTHMDERREMILRWLSSALNAVDPEHAVHSHLRAVDDRLFVADQCYVLDAFEHIYVVGAGKAVLPMARAIEEVLGSRIRAGAIVLKQGASPGGLASDTAIAITHASHPLPDENSMEAGLRALSLATSAGARDLVITLVSGGGSSLWALPRKGITLDELRETAELLLHCGAEIREINTVRKHLTRVAGGQLAQAIYPARSLTLVLSDVLGNPIDMIASGPTAPDSTTFGEAWEIVQGYGLQDKLPKAVRALLTRGRDGRIAENPGPNAPCFKDTQVVVIGDNRAAAIAARKAASQDGYEACVLTTFLEGEAREVGRVVASLGREHVVCRDSAQKRVCYILAGETTVTVKGKGRGGRNQELAMAAACALENVEGVTVAALATDGTDGPTDAAGAVVDGSTCSRGARLGLSARQALRDNDCYPYLGAVGDLLLSGPTDTNVNDLILVVVH